MTPPPPSSTAAASAPAPAEAPPSWDTLDDAALRAYVAEQARKRAAEQAPELDWDKLDAWRGNPKTAPLLSGRAVERLFDLAVVALASGKLDKAEGLVRLVRARARNRNSAFAGNTLLSEIARRRAGSEEQAQSEAVAAVLRELPRSRFGSATVVFQVFQNQDQLSARVEKTRGQLLSLETASTVLYFGQVLSEIVGHRSPFLAAVDAVKSEHAAKPPEKDYAFSTVDLTGKPRIKPIVIGVWDLGTNPALFGKQIFTNAAEKPNGKDDDGNGIVDDIHGVVSDPDPDSQALLYQPGEEILKRYGGFLQGIMDLRAGMASSEAAQQVLALLRSVTDAQALEELERQLGAVGEWAHGTHVAGIMVAGHPQVRLAVFRSAWAGEARVYHRRGPTDQELDAEHANMQRVAAFIRAHEVRVVNASLGFSQEYLENQLRYETDRYKTDEAVRARAAHIQDRRRRQWAEVFKSCPDTLFTVSAGNSNQDVVEYGHTPSDIDLPNVLAVGAVDRHGGWATFTNSNPERVVIFDHGVAVDSLIPSGKRVPLSGTSMSSPNVANLAGKMFAVNPKLTATEARRLIVESGDPIAPPFNGSIANEEKAIALARKELPSQ